MNKFEVVGKREPMLDAFEKATGRARFTDDLTFPEMLYGKILYSSSVIASERQDSTSFRPIPSFLRSSST